MTTQDKAHQEQLLVMAWAVDRELLLHEITRLAKQYHCLIGASRMTSMGQQASLMMVLHGSWSGLARFEVNAQRLQRDESLVISLQRLAGDGALSETLPYQVDVISKDRSDLLHQIVHFFQSRNIQIEEWLTRRQVSPYTQTPVNNYQLIVRLDINWHIITLRDEFADFCDHWNVDAVLEPLKITPLLL